MKERIDEHDMTKKMMDIMRGGYKSKLLTEAEGETMQDNKDMETQKDDSMQEKKVMDVQKGDAVYNEELKKLQAINPRVAIKFFKIYPDEENANVHMGVVFLEGPIGSGAGSNDPNLEHSWMNEGNRSGVYFELSLLDGFKDPIVKNVSNPDLSELLQKLSGFYQNWEDEWAIKLQEDYVGKEKN
jgi:hypothetical protein